MWKIRLFAAMVAVSAAVAVSVAQQQADVRLRSGDQFTGDLLRFTGAEYTFRVGGRDVRVRADDIAVVEMSGARPLSNRQRAQLADGRPFIVLNSGEIIDGRLDVTDNGRRPQFVVRSPRGVRPIDLRSIAGIYAADPGDRRYAGGGDSRDRFGDRNNGDVGRRNPNGDGGFAGGNRDRNDGGVGTAGQQRNGNGRGGNGVPNNGPATFVLQGTQQWLSTNIAVTAGQALHFQASGSVQFSPDPNDHAEPQGPANHHTVVRAPMPNQPGGSLIGRIDNGQPFWIGNQATVNMPAAGTLFIGINDEVVADNSGQFNVVITR